LLPGSRPISSLQNASATTFSRNVQVLAEFKNLGMKFTKIDHAGMLLIQLSTGAMVNKYSKKCSGDKTKKIYLQIAMNDHAKMQKNVSR
jgi:hypothetical protein